MKSVIIITIVLVFLLVPISAYSQTSISSKIPTEFTVIIKPSQQLKVGEETCVTVVLLDSSTRVVYPVPVFATGKIYKNNMFYDETVVELITDHSGFAMNRCDIFENPESISNLSMQFEFMGNEKYLPAKSKIYDFIVLNSQTQKTPTPTPIPQPTPTSSGAIVSIESVIMATVIIAVMAVGIVFAFPKRKKAAPVIADQPAKAQVLQSKEDTQFWVCPNCGNDTQMKDGRQYCASCKIYLSI